MGLKVLTISGKAGSGKDTFAQYLKEQLEINGAKVLITHYADLLKHILTNCFGWNGQKDEYGRSLLQYVGTDVVRKQNPDYWVDFLIGFLKLFDDEWDIVLIPDARFPNEIDGMKNAFDTVSVLVRHEFESQYSEDRQSHISETALDDYVGFDHIVECKTLEELRRHCMGFAKQIL